MGTTNTRETMASCPGGGRRWHQASEVGGHYSLLISFEFYVCQEMSWPSHHPVCVVFFHDQFPVPLPSYTLFCIPRDFENFGITFRSEWWILYSTYVQLMFIFLTETGLALLRSYTRNDSITESKKQIKDIVLFTSLSWDSHSASGAILGARMWWWIYPSCAETVFCVGKYKKAFQGKIWPLLHSGQLCINLLQFCKSHCTSNRLINAP